MADQSSDTAAVPKEAIEQTPTVDDSDDTEPEVSDVEWAQEYRDYDLSQEAADEAALMGMDEVKRTALANLTNHGTIGDAIRRLVMKGLEEMLQDLYDIALPEPDAALHTLKCNTYASHVLPEPFFLSVSESGKVERVGSCVFCRTNLSTRQKFHRKKKAFRREGEARHKAMLWQDVVNGPLRSTVLERSKAHEEEFVARWWVEAEKHDGAWDKKHSKRTVNEWLAHRQDKEVLLKVTNTGNPLSNAVVEKLVPYRSSLAERCGTDTARDV